MINHALKLLGATVLGAAASLVPAAAVADMFVRCDVLSGTELGPDGERNWFIAESFGFGVEREMKESGEKGGSSEPATSAPSLSEIVVTKSMDIATVKLAQYAIEGNSPGACLIALTNGTDANAKPICYLAYKLDRAFIKSWSTSGLDDERPTEEVAFYYSSLSTVFLIEDGRQGAISQPMKWDNLKQSGWTGDVDEELLDLLGTTPPPRGD